MTATLTAPPTVQGKNLKGQMRSASLDRDVCRVKAVAGATADDPGYLEGYLAVFGNVDYAGERLMKGCFHKTLDRVRAGRIPLMTKHMAYGGDVADIVGKITEAKEDDYGLWIHAGFARTECAQEARQLILDEMVSGLSIGYQIMRNAPPVLDPETDLLVYDIIEVKLWEGTVTAFPMNELARVTGGKTILELTENEKQSAEDTSLEAIGKSRDWDADFTDCERTLILNERYLQRVKTRSSYNDAPRIIGGSGYEPRHAERFALAG